MKIQQLSVFVENKPGQLVAPCRVLAEAGVNIITLSLADTREFGILRLVVTDAERARAALAAGGYVVQVTEVLAVEVADRPGGLAALLEKVDRACLSIEYMYAFTRGEGDRAVLLFRFTDIDLAVEALRDAGESVLAAVELFNRAGG